MIALWFNLNKHPASYRKKQSKTKPWLHVRVKNWGTARQQGCPFPCGRNAEEGFGNKVPGTENKMRLVSRPTLPVGVRCPHLSLSYIQVWPVGLWIQESRTGRGEGSRVPRRLSVDQCQVSCRKIGWGEFVKNTNSLAILPGILTHEMGRGAPRQFLTSSSGVSGVDSSLRSMG